MIDKDRMYLQVPKIIEKDGLAKILTDINGNEFNADLRKTGSELIIDYPHERGKGMRVIDYEVCVDPFNRKYWREVRKRQWVPDENISFCGKWKEGWDE